MVKRIRIAESDNKPKRRINRRRSMKEARQKITNYLNFSELNAAQQEQAIDVAMEDDGMRQLFDDVQMEDYKYMLDERAKEFTDKTGIEVNTDKLYWGCSSQGPYPEWGNEKVFDETEFNVGEYTIEIYLDGSLTVKPYVNVYLGNEFEYEADGVRDLKNQGYDEIATFVDRITFNAQDFIDDVWNLIHDVCTAYPDELWMRDTLEANDYEFEIDDDDNVVRMA